MFRFWTDLSAIEVSFEFSVLHLDFKFIHRFCSCTLCCVLETLQLWDDFNFSYTPTDFYLLFCYFRVLDRLLIYRSKRQKCVGVICITLWTNQRIVRKKYSFSFSLPGMPAPGNIFKFIERFKEEISHYSEVFRASTSHWRKVIVYWEIVSIHLDCQGSLDLYIYTCTSSY